MSFYILYKPDFDDIIFKLWLNHYRRLQFDIKIVVSPPNVEIFKQKYPKYINKIIHDIPQNALFLTETDFLFSYKKSLSPIEETMLLSYEIDPLFLQQSILIGRVFHIPIEKHDPFTTFEIPDFILYQQRNHTHYTKYGVSINKGTTVSQNIVCLSLCASPIPNPKQYYKTNILVRTGENPDSTPYFETVYEDFMMNVNVNKKHNYGVIWHPKCGCTTITRIFCMVNRIQLEPEKQKSLCFRLKKYRYNTYLQNVDFISFTRNPLERFVSTFLDKHVYRTDPIYISLGGYHEFTKKGKETLENLCSFLIEGGYISNHYTRMSDCSIYWNHSYKNVKIDNGGLNQQLYAFLEKYHKPENNIESQSFLNKKWVVEDVPVSLSPTSLIKNEIMSCFENVRDNKQGKEECLDRQLPFPAFERDDWEKYLEKYNVRYELILESVGGRLTESLRKLYKHDMELFGY